MAAASLDEGWAGQLQYLMQFEPSGIRWLACMLSCHFGNLGMSQQSAYPNHAHKCVWKPREVYIEALFLLW